MNDSLLVVKILQSIKELEGVMMHVGYAHGACLVEVGLHTGWGGGEGGR